MVGHDALLDMNPKSTTMW